MSKFSLTHHFETYEELTAHLAKCGSGGCAVEPEAVEEKPKPKRGRPKGSTKKKEDAKKPEADAEKDADAEGGIDFKEFKKQGYAAVTKHGKDAVMMILEEYNAEKFPDVKPEDYQAILDAYAEL